MSKFETVLNTIIAEGNYDAKPVEVIKNGITYKGVSVKPSNGNVGVNFYLDDSYEDWGIDEITDFIYDRLQNIPPINVEEQLYDFDNLTIGVKAQAANLPVSEGVVYKQVLDVLLIPVIVIGSFDDGMATAKITESMLASWDKTLDEVFDKIDTSYTFKTMREVLSEMMPGFEETIPVDDGPQMNILSNKDKMNGGSLIFFENVQKDIYEKMGGKYVVLPSSVHESIVLPMNNEDDIPSLRAMVGEVNDTQVSDDDRLTYSVYVYDGTELKVA